MRTLIAQIPGLQSAIVGDKNGVSFGNITTVFAHVTPENAATWLANKRKNRPLNSSKIRLMRGDMVRGDWPTTHQGVAFNQYGQLIDGQNRLEAVRLAKTPLVMLVSVGIDDDAFYAIDTNSQKKGNATILSVKDGVKNANRVAAIARAVQAICTGDPDWKSQSTRQCEKVIDLCGGIIEQVASDSTSGREYKPDAIVSAPFVLLYSFDEQGGRQMMSEMVNATDRQGSASRALRQYMNNFRTKNGYQIVRDKAMAACHAIVKRNETVVSFRPCIQSVKSLCAMAAPLVEKMRQATAI